MCARASVCNVRVIYLRIIPLETTDIEKYVVPLHVWVCVCVCLRTRVFHDQTSCKMGKKKVVSVTHFQKIEDLHLYVLES